MVKCSGMKNGIRPYLIDPLDKWCILEALTGIILKHVPGSIVEIGTSHGDSMYHRRKSTNIFAEKAMMARVPFYTCDIKHRVEIDYTEHYHFAGSSLDFIEQFDKTGFAIVFLDGCHDYGVVIKEFYFFYKRLNLGGMIFLHDTSPLKEKMLRHGACSDCYKVRQEIEQKRDKLDCDVMTWPYSCGKAGLTMVLKKDPNRPYYRR